MDLEFTDDDDELRANVRAVLSDIASPSVVRDIYEGRADGESVWRQMVALDWPGLAIAEEHGGIGLGFVEVGIVCEELGRTAAPGHYLATVTQFAPLLRELGGQGALLAEVAAGRVTGTVALAEHGSWDPAAVTAAATAGPDGSWTLAGAKTGVLDGAGVDEVAVVARGADGLGVFLVPGRDLATTSRLSLDPTMPVADLALDGTVVPADRVLAPPGPEATEAVRRATQEATIALAVTGTAACRAIFEQTVAYAKEREQYGKLIGSFQALKHRMANMYLALERASSLCWYAALTIAEDDPRRDEAASLAKAAAGECQRLLVQDGLQLHGGIGYTWEHDLHFLLNRARVCGTLYGNATHHRARLADLLGLTAEVAA